MSDLDETLRTNAEGPAEASGDSGRIRQHSLADQIAADRYLESKRARDAHPARALSRVKIVPPGTA